MNRFKRSFYAALAMLVTITACDRPECRNANPVFDKYAPSETAYKTELARRIAHIGQDNLEYWFDHYEKTGDKEYIVAHVQGKELCARAHMRVYNWEKISGLRSEQPTGYHGAGLSGMRIIASGDAAEPLVFAGLDRIID